jgi:hypothetical protein
MILNCLPVWPLQIPPAVSKNNSNLIECLFTKTCHRWSEITLLRATLVDDLIHIIKSLGGRCCAIVIQPTFKITIIICRVVHFSCSFGAQIVLISRRDFQIIFARMVTWNKFQREDPQFWSSCEPGWHVVLCSWCVWTDTFLFQGKKRHNFAELFRRHRKQLVVRPK